MCSRERSMSAGNSAVAAIRADSGKPVSGSRHGPWSRPFTRSSATGLSRRVVTTSSIPKRTRSSAGTSAHAAPASAPPTTMTGRASSGGRSPTIVPMPAAAIAPSRSWPSAPMFQ